MLQPLSRRHLVWMPLTDATMRTQGQHGADRRDYSHSMVPGGFEVMS